MKQIFMLLVACVAMVFVSCSKDDDDAVPLGSKEGVVTMTAEKVYVNLDVETAKAGDLITIDWGDGNIEEFTTVKEEEDGEIWYEVDTMHTYPQAGSHTIKVTGALTDLSCDGNDLTALDVSKCTALTGLGCQNNSLTTLDVSKNTALTGLSCHYNHLTSLDVSKNTALTGLGCPGNNLTTLDVSKNTALTELGCPGNNLTTVDVSKNTALTDLRCGGNNLTTLDVSKNTALTGLGCDHNNLTTLDVSKNTALTELACDGNNFSATALNKIFTDLPQRKTSNVSIGSNPGSATCNKSIATNKGWKVSYY